MIPSQVDSSHHFIAGIVLTYVFSNNVIRLILLLYKENKNHVHEKCLQKSVKTNEKAVRVWFRGEKK